MNTKKLIAAVAVFAAAGPALADNTTYPYVDHSKFVSTKTRDEVRKETIQAAKLRQIKSDATGG